MKSSSFLDKIFQKGPWESLDIKGEASPLVKAARMVAKAAYIKAGKESREIGGTAISHLDQVAQELKSDNFILRLSALMVFDAIQEEVIDDQGREIKKADPDPNYQKMIESSLVQQSRTLKNADDEEFFEKMTGIAKKHKMATVLPAIIDGLGTFFKQRSVKPDDPEGLGTWHVHMQLLMELAIELSNGSFDKLQDYLENMVKKLEIQIGDTTYIRNTLYLGFLFALVRSHKGFSPEDFIAELNKVRAVRKFEPVREGQIQIGFDFIDPVARLRDLNDRNNVDQNVQDLVTLGGPIYFQDLLELFNRTNHLLTVKAILNVLPAVLSMGVYPRDNNPWDAAIEEKAKHPDLGIKDAVKTFELRNEFGTAVLHDLKEGDRLTVISTLEMLSASPFLSDVFVPYVIPFVFSENNPILDTMRNGQEETEAFNKVLSLAANVIVRSGISDSQRDHLIRINTRPTVACTLTAKQLRGAINVAVKSNKIEEILAELIKGEALEWDLAEQRFSQYARSGQGDPKELAETLLVANQMYKRPSDQGTGYSIVDKYMKMYGTDDLYFNPISLSRMADVFEQLAQLESKDDQEKKDNKNWAFQQLSALLNVHFPNKEGESIVSPDLDAKVLKLFHDLADPQQIQTAQFKIIEVYVYWYRNYNPQNGKSGTDFRP